MRESSHKLWAAICHHALVKPDEPAILHYGSSLETASTWQQLQQEVAQLASRLRHENVSSVALYADNSAAWIIVDLACNLAEITLLPLPGFFSAQQLQHALQTVQVDVIVTDNAAHIAALAPDGFTATEGVCGLEYLVSADRPVNQRRESHPPGVPGGTRKVTFTSGSTGTPKGVCLSAAHLEAVTTSLLDTTASCDIERHLCVLPLATLLENIAGVHAPLRRGAQVIVARESVLGFNGASGFSLPAFLDVLAHCRPNSLILIPQLLEALVLSCDSGWKLPDSLRFIAVGGATVSASLLERAWSHGLLVHEGYGLSECGSVVSLNAPGARRNGSLGRPLPHNRVEIVEGEIVVHGNVFLGYAGDAASWRAADTAATYATGDLGYMDAEGYLHFIGRRKNQLVSSFGRNISPEWIEAELAACAPIAQSIVFGDSRPYCVALIVARHPRISDAQIADSIQQVNATLPDYARIKRWTRLASPLARGTGSDDDLLTSNGRPRRARIEEHFRNEIDALYATSVGAPTSLPQEATSMFYENLQNATEADRQSLVSSEIIRRCMVRDVTLDEYIAFLTQAYHHVKYTVPLLMAVGARLPDHMEWLREAVAEYIKDELGHQEWILNDLAACGADKEAVRHSQPAIATELMVAYAWDMVNRRNPIGFFGMVQVLEGTSVSLADYAADQIKEALGLPERAFTYLRSHGSIDQTHIKYLQELINRFTDPQDQALLIHSTKMFYRLYKGVFDSLIEQTEPVSLTH
ncbi:MAG: hypothetical protein A3H44_05540 [Gammaproteobacteria bacterium RIFCSPLOWO2_02_FULL_57_10]|nr:MAG: hypothetical protein A3H44_05540 [Gammaproteobacteria bacterium RIFCSPLOWO2_02_FULL_57_10]